MRGRDLSIALLALSLVLLTSISFAGKSKKGGGSLPESINPPGEKVIIVDPRVHKWGAYSADGKLLRTGLATAGSGWCRDIGRSCRTKVGIFRIYSLGGPDCKSHKFPRRKSGHHGGAPMPYCMFFNGGQALHGSAAGNVIPANVSHGCVRLYKKDASWLRYQFIEGPHGDNNYRGTKVIIRPY